MNKKLMSFLLLSGLMLLTITIWAQGGPPPPTGTPLPYNGPIDGGVFTVLGASVAYGAKKLYNKNKQKKQEQA